MKDKRQIYQFTIGELGGEVDRKSSIIRGVSVITGNVNARGHNLQVDDTTLQQMTELGNAKGQVPSKWNHQSGADEVNGYLTNFRIEGFKVKADWHLLETHPRRDQALELAERMPTGVGFSTSFSGLSELADGTKVYPADAKSKDANAQVPHLLVDGVPVPVPPGEKVFARAEELLFVDLVATPAANPDGMFSAAPVDTAAQSMAIKPNTEGATPTDEVSLAALLTEFRQFSKGIDERIARIETAFSADPGNEEDPEGEDPEGEEEGEEEGEGEATELTSIPQVIQHFERRLAQAEAARETREFAAAQAELGVRIHNLMAANDQLTEQNRVLAQAYKELSAKTKTVVEFSPGKDGTPRPQVRAAGGRPQTEFEARVTELERGGKPKHQALIAAVEEDTGRYERHLEAIGTFSRL